MDRGAGQLLTTPRSKVKTTDWVVPPDEPPEMSAVTVCFPTLPENRLPRGTRPGQLKFPLESTVVEHRIVRARFLALIPLR